MNRFALLAALVAATPVTAVIAQASMAPTAYIAQAGAGDQYEIQSSQLVLQTTANPALREFATMMVAHHNKSTADVKTAATAAGVTAPPPQLDAKGRTDVAALRRASGTQRDTLYVAQQKAAHAKALALHTAYARDGKAAPLKAAATQIVPVVQGHIDRLAAM